MDKEDRLGNPDTLDEDERDGAFTTDGTGLARPLADALREAPSREVPQTRPMAAIDEASIEKRIARRKADAKARVPSPSTPSLRARASRSRGAPWAPRRSRGPTRRGRS
jgi:hypothetical protein